MADRTTEEIATIFKNAGDSVTIINRLAALSSLTTEQKERVKRNVDHLERIKTYKKEGYEGKLLKPNTHVAKHDKVSSTTWKFLKKAKEKTEPELKPTRRSSRRTRTKKNTITKSEE